MNPKDFPRVLVIGDSIWKVRLVNVIKEPGHGRGQIFGLTCPDLKLIKIVKSLPDREFARTYVHEVCHAIEEEYDIEIPHWLIYALEEPILDFIIENFTGVGSPPD